MVQTRGSGKMLLAVAAAGLIAAGHGAAEEQIVRMRLNKVDRDAAQTLVAHQTLRKRYCGGDDGMLGKDFVPLSNFLDAQVRSRAAKETKTIGTRTELCETQNMRNGCTDHRTSH